MLSVRWRLTANRRGFNLVELLVVIAIIGILVALLLPAIQAARESARRTECRSHLREIGLALQSYHDAKGRFPTGRNRSDQFGTSWAFSLLPYLEQQAVHGAFVEGERVDSEANASAMRRPIPLYFCPSRRQPAADRDFDDNDQPSQVRGVAAGGDYAANAGLEEDIGMEDNDFVAGKIDLTLAGPLFSGSAIKMRQVTDGLSNTIAIGDKHIRPVRDEWDEGTQHARQGDSCFLASDSLTTIMRGTEDGLADGPDDPSDEVFGSEHPGVVQFVFLDGHAEALSTSNSGTAIGVNPEQVSDINIADEWLWLGALSTVAGSEIMSR